MDEPSKEAQHARKRLKKSSSRKCTPNRRWSAAMDDVLIPFLAKASHHDQRFDKSTFAKAAALVNASIPGAEMTASNVANHYKTIQGWWDEITKLLNLSGVGWDEEEKKITMDLSTYYTYTEAHKNAIPFINKPISHFEDLRLICGDNRATGQFAKSIFSEFGAPSGSSTRVNDISREEEIDHDRLNVPITEPLVDPPPMRQIPPQVSYSAGSLARSTATQYVRSDQGGNVYTQAVENISLSLSEVARELRLIGTTLEERLGSVLFGLEGFTERDLDRFHNYLCDNQKQAKTFLGKPQDIQRMYVEDFIECQRTGSTFAGVGSTNSI